MNMRGFATPETETKVNEEQVILEPLKYSFT